MAPLRIMNIASVTNVIANHRFSTSQVQYSDKVSQAYPFYWWSMRDNKTEQFHSGIQLVLKDVHLPIIFNNNSGSLLVKLGPENVAFNQALQQIEDAIRSALPEHMKHALQPLKRIPDMGDPSLSLKCRYCAIDAEQSTADELMPRNIITHAVISMQKLTSYNQKLYISCQLQACRIREPTADDLQSLSGCGQLTRLTDDEMFDLMD